MGFSHIVQSRDIKLKPRRPILLQQHELFGPNIIDSFPILVNPKYQHWRLSLAKE